METLKKIIDKIKTLPFPWMRYVALLLVCVLAILLMSSCGTTRAVVHTQDSGMATITITTQNPTEVTTSPNVSLTIPSKQ